MAIGYYAYCVTCRLRFSPAMHSDKAVIKNIRGHVNGYVQAFGETDHKAEVIGPLPWSHVMRAIRSPVPGPLTK